MNFTLKSNAELLQEIGIRLRRCRINANETQSDLAHKAGISLSLLKRAEGGQSVGLAHLLRIMRILNLLENIGYLVPDEEISPILLKKLKGRERKRASKKGISYG